MSPVKIPVVDITWVGREKEKRRRANPEVREIENMGQRLYRQTPEGKEWRRSYDMVYRQNPRSECQKFLAHIPYYLYLTDSL